MPADREAQLARTEASGYELGCSSGCKTAHSYQWGRCHLAVPPAPELNLYAFETWTASDGYLSGGYRRVTVAEALAEIEKFQQEAPDAG